MSKDPVASSLRSWQRYCAPLGGLVISIGLWGSWDVAQANRPPSTLPVLRVEAVMHTAHIRKPAVDAKRDRLVTASDDKTIRIWQLPQGRLVRVLRVPIDAGFEGRLNVVDIHPDGRTLAAGGWTGWDFDGAGFVYLFDGETGELVRRVGGFPETIGTLGFARDGKSLVVGLQGAKGLRVLRTSDYAEVARDLEYGDRILDLGFAPDGRLVVASLDGYLRLYDQGFHLIGRRKTTTGKQPLSIKFSPDGRFIAVGFNDLAPPAIYAGDTLDLLYSVDASAIRDQRRLQNIHWSDTGQALYATGEYAGPGKSRIYRWDQSGRGAIKVIEVEAQRPGGLIPLSGGRMAFVSEDPAIGILDPSGHAKLIARAGIPDFRARGAPIRTSRDSTGIEFQVRDSPGTRYRFSLGERTVVRADAADFSFQAPRQTSSHFVLEHWQNDTRPVLNGRTLELDEYETARSYAIAHDDSMLVLGTEWAVRAFDHRGRGLWRTRAPAVVWQVNLSPDGKSVVAALSDGTMRWFRSEDGAEYLAFFFHPATAEWIAWTPQGYYVSSNNGDQYIGWHLNRGRGATPLFYRAVQFERLLYRPDIVEAAVLSRDPNATSPTGEGETFDVAQLATIAPPVVRLTALGSATQPTGGVYSAKVRIEARVDSLPMRDLTVFVNNIPVTPGRSRRLRDAETKVVSRDVTVELPDSENTVHVEISNGRAMGIGDLVIDAGPTPSKRVSFGGDLYIVAVGVNRFPLLKPRGESVDLHFAARDADEIVEFFRTTGPGYFRHVFPISTSDDSAEQPTRERIVRALDVLSKAGERDTVVVFLASHGLSDNRGNYFFVPSDARTEDWLAVESGIGVAPSMIPWTVFFDALRQAAGRRILIVDTCRASDIEGRFDLHSLAKRSASARFALVAAAKGDEKSQEFERGQHGLFTYALLKALRSDANADRDGHVTLRKAFEAAVPIVERLRKPIGPQTPQLDGPPTLYQTVLVRRPRQ